MAKNKKEKPRNISKKPKHSLDANRKNRSDGKCRSAATVRRLRMYKNKPNRNRKGKILKHEFQSKQLPNTRIHPDRRYFGNTRVLSQKDLEFFRQEMQNKMSSSYNVVLNNKNLPLSLFNNQ